MEIASPHDLTVLREPERIAPLLDPERRRLLDELGHRPDSATGLARRLGDTRQRLNYHLKALEAAGLVEVAEERPRRGVAERVYRPAARRFLVDPGALAGFDPGEAASGDRFSGTWLVALAARAIRELADLLERARGTGKRLLTVGMSSRVRLSTPADFEAFAEDLARAVADVVARHHRAEGDGRTFRVMAGGWPVADDGITESEDDDG